MTLRTKNVTACCLLGLAAVALLNALDFGSHGSYASEGWSWNRTLTFVAVPCYLFFNWFLIRALTGIRIFGRLFGLEPPKKPVRQFSWALLLLAPVFLGGPVWLFMTQGALVHYIVAGGAFGGMLLFYVLVAPADGTQAYKKFKENYASTPKG